MIITHAHGSCHQHANGNFSDQSPAVMREVMRLLRDGKPFGWMRWADAEMLEGVHLRDTVRKFEHIDSLVVNVGVWWLCDDRLRSGWNAAVPADLDFVFHDFFYLPTGIPDDDARDMWDGLGIRGWVRTAHEVGRKLAVIGPRHLQTIPWLRGADYIEAGQMLSSVRRYNEVLSRAKSVSAKHADEPVLFVLSAGSGAKVLIVDMMSSPENKDMFVDVGASLDGFAGVHSRAFNSGEEFIRKYCENILREDPWHMDLWLSPGVCPEHRLTLDN